MIESLAQLPGFVTRSSRHMIIVSNTVLPGEITIDTPASSQPNFQFIQNEVMEKLIKDHAGILANGFDHIAITVPWSSLIPFWGFADLAGSRIFLNGYQESMLVAHEFGHNLGLSHAHAWQSYEPENPISPIGAWLEYGDPYDPMGNYWQGLDYNSAYKHRLGWISENEVLQVLGSGDYVLYRHDHEDASGPVQGLVVGYGPKDRFWLEYRKEAPPGYQADGVLIRRMSDDGLDHPGGVGATELLDLNGHDIPGFTDSPLTLGDGKVFTDPAVGIKITVTEYGGVEPNQYIGLRIEAMAPPPRLLFANLTNFQVLPLYQKFSVTTQETPGAQLVTRVELWVDGMIRSVGTSAVSTLEWTPSQLGRSIVKIRTIDVFGRTTDSPAVSVQVIWDAKPAYAIAEGVRVSQLTAGDAGWVALVDGSLAFSDVPFQWDRSRVTADPGFVVRDIAYSRGVFVAVGEGAIHYSADGRHWKPATLPVQADFEGVTTLANEWFAVGRRGAVARSADGISWSMVPLATDGDFVGIASSPGELVAVGTKGERIRFDGVSWDEPASVWGVQFKAVAYGGGRFVAWAARPSDTEAICTSKDGRSWTVRGSIGVTGEERITAFGAHAGLSYVIGAFIDIEASRPGWVRLISAREHYTEIAGWGRHLLLVAPAEGSTSFAYLEVPADPYREWSTSAFGDPDRVEADPEADPENDGLANQIEYAVGTDPLVRDASRDITISEGRAGEVSFEFGFPEIRPDLRYLIESTTDFGTWRFEFEYPNRVAAVDGEFRYFRLRTERIPY